MRKSNPLIHRLIGRQLPVRIRLYNLFFVFLLVVGFFGTLTCISLHSSVTACVIAGASTVVFGVLYALFRRFPDHTERIITAALVFTNFFSLPALYLTGGSIHSGIAGFFAAGLAITLFFTEGRRGILLTAAESVWCLAVYALSLKYSENLTVVPAEEKYPDVFPYLAIGSNVLIAAVGLCFLARIIFSMLRQENHIVENSVEELTRRAKIDSLTGLYNRRALFEYLDEQVDNALKTEQPLSVILFDIDSFKAVNDHYGHTVGDEALCAISRLLLDSVTGPEFAARYGGEEFLLILPGSNRYAAKDKAEQIRKTIESTRLSESLPENHPVTVSAGVAEFDITLNPDRLVALADSHMYDAKSLGKNRVFGA